MSERAASELRSAHGTRISLPPTSACLSGLQGRVRRGHRRARRHDREPLRDTHDELRSSENRPARVLLYHGEAVVSGAPPRRLGFEERSGQARRDWGCDGLAPVRGCCTNLWPWDDARHTRADGARLGTLSPSRAISPLRQSQTLPFARRRAPGSGCRALSLGTERRRLEYRRRDERLGRRASVSPSDRETPPSP